MKYFFRVLFSVYIVLIIWVSLNPSSGITRLDINESSYRVDYLLHAIAFLVLPIIAYFSSSDSKTRKFWWTLITISVVIAIGTEFLQKFVPDRTFNPLDILSNISGLFIGVILVFLYQKIKNRKNK